MKTTLKLIQRLKVETPSIRGVRPCIAIRSRRQGGLFLEAQWYCERTYRYQLVCDPSFIMNEACPNVLVDEFIRECKDIVKGIGVNDEQ